MKDGKKRRKRNIIGAAVMAGLIFAAMPLGVAHSMEDLRDDAESAYYYDSTGYAIYDGLAHPEIISYTQALEYQVQANESAHDDTFYWAGATNMEMGAAAQALALELEKLPLEEKDKKYPAQMIAQMRSEQDKIERSSYNDEARAFNARLHSFPVNLLRNFTDVKELIPFDEHGAVVEDTAVQEPERDYAGEEAAAEQSTRQEESLESTVEAWAEGYAEKIEDRVGQIVEDKLDP